MEIECLELLIDRIRRAYLVDRSIDLQIIVIYHNTEVVQLTEACEHGCLPYLAFLDLTVTQQCVYTEITILHLCTQCHTYCCGNALSQGSGRHIHAGDMDAGMTLQIGTQVTQSRQILYREISSVSQCGIESGSCMTLGQYESVTLLHIGILWVNVHLLKI